MRHRDYIADREERDTAFRKAREELRPQLEFRKALIGARLRSGFTQKDLADRLKQTAREGGVTFVYAAHDEKHNSAVVLKQFLR